MSTFSKLVALFYYLGLIRYSLAQPEIGTRDPCAAQILPSPGRRYSDNLSCPRFGNESSDLLCFLRVELCNGEEFCDLGSDEGTDNVTSLHLDCDGSVSGRGTAMFICANGQTIDLIFPFLCDGFPHCFDGSDETNALCENRCLLPYYGKCPHTRECRASGSSGVHCGECLPGYVEHLSFPGGNCIVDPCQQSHNGGCPRTRRCTFSSITGVRCDNCLPGYVQNPINPTGECLVLNELLDISTGDPCSVQIPPSPGTSFSDNLSCQHAFGASDIQCFNRSQLCDGIELCGFQEDEGFGTELVCSTSTTFGHYFVCDEFSGENVSIETLCDGVRDCVGGRDETNILCENKCLPPYNGGCPATRWCIVTIFGAQCGECLPGYVKNPDDPNGDCIFPACGPLPFPANSFVQLFSSPLGINITTATYTCENGYKLIGEDTRICQANGNWTGSAPTCEDGCGPLPSPVNGAVQISPIHDEESRRETFIAVYTCNIGYRLDGNDSRTCQADQNWSGSESKCEGCGHLLSPANGDVHISSSPFGISASYVCYEGYKLIGDEFRMCQINSGTWSGSRPVCEIIDCGSLHDPANGVVVYSSTVYDSIATYSCDRGYELFGESTRTCHTDGNWTESEPVCKMLVIGFERDSYSANEAAESLTICVSLNLEAALLFPVERITLRITTVEGTAGEDDYSKIDRQSPNSVIIIENTRRRHCILVSITDDTHYEQDELFSLRLEFSKSETSSNVEIILAPNVTTITILANDVFFPYGEGNQNISRFTEEDIDDFSPPAIILEKPFIFFGEEESVLFVNTNGLLSFREAHTTPFQDYFTDDPSIPLIAPFWADIDISDRQGEIFYYQTNTSTPLNHAVTLVNEAAGLSLEGNLTNVFVATWDNVAGFGEDSEKRNTFQVALASDGNKSYLFFIYGHIGWIDSDTNIGFKNANGSQFFMLPESPTEAAIEKLNLVQSSNIGVPSFYLYQIDDASELAPKILLSNTEKPNHMLEYSVDLRNSFCLENSTEETNFTLHCEAEHNMVPHSVQWFYSLDTNIPESSHEIVHNEEYSIMHFEGGNHTLSFGPTSVSEIHELFNTSSENASLVITCSLKNEFGQDTKSIEISQCALTECQDGVTNNCTQICHKDTSGVHHCYCRTGYRIQSDSATCEVVDCDPPSPLSNGVVIVSSLIYNSTVMFICNGGYELVGESNTTCQHNGNWTDTGPICRDIDECEVDESICDLNAYCINTNGSYQCVCVTGYEGNGTTCEDIDECDEQSHNCTVSSQCVNRNGSFSCVCLPGFQFSDGMTCQAKTENQIEIILGATVAGVLAILFSVMLTLCCLLRFYYHVQGNKLRIDTSTKKSCMSQYQDSSCSTEGQARDLKYFKVHSSSDVVKDIHHELLIHSANLRILETVGQGEFGVVYKAHMMKDLGQTIVGVVAVKTLKGFFDELLVDGLLRECLKMQQFYHPNVVSLTGVCLDGGPTPFLVMPFMENGSLLSYLRNERASLAVSPDYHADNKDEIVSVALKRLLDMCLQIAKGMEYLASMRFVHRDLAARNCMIDMNYVIKVADFGLTEQLETKDYFRQDKSDVIKLPIKWLAPESLTDYVFSEKSDIWAYGVTCWEIFSSGKAPYASINPTELLSMLESGYRMERPANVVCSDEIYSVMLQCWMAEPTERPTFSNLVEKLSYTLEVMAGYLHIGAFDRDQQSLTIERV